MSGFVDGKVFRVKRVSVKSDNVRFVVVYDGAVSV